MIEYFSTMSRRWKELPAIGSTWAGIDVPPPTACASVIPSLGARNRERQTSAACTSWSEGSPRESWTQTQTWVWRHGSGSVQSKGARWSLLHKAQRASKRSPSVQMIKAMQGEIEVTKKKKRTVCLKQACLKKNRALLALNNLLYRTNTPAPTLLWASAPRDESIFIASKVNIDHSNLEISDPKVLISTLSISWPPTLWQALVAPALQVFHGRLALGGNVVRLAPLCSP